ncbi:hypothetical protein [Streptomyces sp. 2132.2]|nr:hypothetical protein [Streptomyces sp. 2132.2]
MTSFVRTAGDSPDSVGGPLRGMAQGAADGGERGDRAVEPPAALTRAA